jgi:signal transduction histidine kinase/ActR/RegA family two-component response regulator
MRVVQPWYEGGHLIGFLELGHEIRQPRIAYPRRAGRRCARDAGRGVHAHVATPGQDPGVGPSGPVLLESSLEEVPVGLLDRILAGESGLLLDDSGRLMYTASLQLFDAAERVIGQVVILRDATALQARFRESLTTVALFVLLAGTMVFGLVYAILGRVERDHRRQREMETQFARLSSEHQRIVQMEKLAEVGRTISEIAHQINNPLVGVINMAQLAEREADDPVRVRELLAEIRSAGDDCHAFVQRMLAFTRLSRIELAPADLSALVRDTIALFAQSTPQCPEIVAGLPDTPVLLDVDAVLVRHALFNLLSNAAAASPPGATVEVTLRPEEGPERAPGWLLSVRDRGPGLPAGTLDRIFEPFFTTRAWRDRPGPRGGPPRRDGPRRHDYRRTTCCRRWREICVMAASDPIQTRGCPVTAKILLVDDDRYTANLFQGLFRRRPERLDVAPDVAAGRRLFRANDYNLILMDQRLPDGSGLDLVQEMLRERSHQIAIMITGHADVRDAVRAVREGLFDYLTKPFSDLDVLEATIDKALEVDRAYRQIDTLNRTLEGRDASHTLIGRSPAIETMLQQIRQIAALDTSVLLQGESGTGKELVARMIHAGSGRARRPFLEVNCGAFSEPLLESTLFGYEKGAFTGAVRATPWLPGAGGRRLAVSGRGRRHEPQAAEQPAPGDPGADIPAAGRNGAAFQRFSPDLRLQPPAGRRGPREALPRRPVLPDQRGRDPDTAPARAPGGHPGARAAFPRPVQRTVRQGGRAFHARRDRPDGAVPVARQRAPAPARDRAAGGAASGRTDSRQPA